MTHAKVVTFAKVNNFCLMKFSLDQSARPQVKSKVKGLGALTGPNPGTLEKTILGKVVHLGEGINYQFMYGSL